MNKPKGVKPNVSAGVSYNVELQKIVRAIRKDINATVMQTLRNVAPEYQRDSAIVYDSWVDVLTGALSSVRARWSSERFKRLADDVARRFIVTSNQSNLRRTETDLGINLYADNAELSDYIQASIADNVRLIESIPEQYLTQVESIVMSNVRAGNRPAAVAKQLSKQFNITERRAKLIARDQVSKVNSNLASMRIRSVGYEYFKWQTSSDERVRDRHEEVSERVTAYGKGIFKFSNPPVVDQNQQQLPGEPIQCRCIMIPISQEEVEANKKAGRTVPGVLR